MGVATEPNRAMDRREHLTANEYELDPAGVVCRILRQPRKALGGEEPVTAAWACHIDRATAFSVTYDSATGAPTQRYIVTHATFPFDHTDPDDEAAQLEAARKYCVDVAHAVATLRPALDGLLSRVEATIKDAVREHGAVPLKFD